MKMDYTGDLIVIRNSVWATLDNLISDGESIRVNLRMKRSFDFFSLFLN